MDGEVLHTAADGNGPVNALDAALRKALRAFYPVLDGVHLRRLQGPHPRRQRRPPRPARGWSSTRPTAARTWSTMGSDTNIIAASAAALADSLEYAIWKSGARAAAARRAPLHRAGAGRGRAAVSGPAGRARARRRASRRPAGPARRPPAAGGHRAGGPPPAPLDHDDRLVGHRSRAAVVLAAGDSQWEGTAESAGRDRRALRRARRRARGRAGRPGAPRRVRRPRDRRDGRPRTRSSSWSSSRRPRASGERASGPLPGDGPPRQPRGRLRRRVPRGAAGAARRRRLGRRDGGRRQRPPGRVRAQAARSAAAPSSTPTRSRARPTGSTGRPGVAGGPPDEVSPAVRGGTPRQPDAAETRPCAPLRRPRGETTRWASTRT